MNTYIKFLCSAVVLMVMSLGVVAQTSVQFTAASATKTEAGTSYDITIAITNEDAGNATTVEVALTAGTAVDLDNYTTQMVTFPAASAANQTVTVTITDDATVESAETFTFTLQNVAGGNAAVIGGQSTTDLIIVENDITSSGLIINEIHADPASSTPGDANGDGVRDAADDEFIELVNTGSGDLDISGYEIFDTNSSVLSRHVFPASTVVPAGGAIVVFGGGSPTGSFGNSIVQTASSGGVGTTNSSETLIVQDASDRTIIFYTYGSEGNDNQSITRDVDITGSDNPMTKHSVATGAGGALFSPGTKIDGSLFIVPASTEVQFSGATASIDESGGTVDLTVLITGEDASNATTVEVALTGGSGTNGSDITTYATTTLTFPAASSSSQTVTLTITDDTDVEGSEDLVFTLQNPGGGNSTTVGTQSTHTLTIVDNDFAATDLVVNEFMAWPAGSSSSESQFDSNGDGTYGSSSDEYIEFVNSGSGDLDISGWKINDGIDRHIFPANTIIPAGGGLVVFGGGTPSGTFGNSIIQTATESSSLGLLNSGDELFIKDDSDQTRLTFSYGASTRTVAMVRNPDITGDFEAHAAISAYTKEDMSNATASPGLKIDGSLFIVPTSTEVKFSSATTSANEGDGTVDLTVSIVAEDASNATTVEVALTGGSATNGTDITTYATQTLTFPAASSASQMVTLTITDDIDVEGNENLIFTLQNAAGGTSAVIGAQSTHTLTIVDNDFEGTDLVVNEYMPWPAGSTSEATQFDSNGDGTYGSSSDEYIEFVNSGSSDMDISGWKINDGIDRHIFPANSVVPAGGAIVVFGSGGGAPTGAFGNSVVQTASESTSLGLLNSGDEITIKDGTDATRLTFSYDQATRAVAFSRSPDITGEFSAHAAISAYTNEDATNAAASPGLKVDGTFFIEQTTTLVQFESSSVTVNEGDGSFDISVVISLPDGSIATTADVVLTSTDPATAADFNDFATQSITFAAGSSTTQTFTVTITDDADIEGQETFTFELQNVAGGNSAAAGATATFTVTMNDNDFPASDLVLNEFLPYPSSTSIADAAEVDANGDGTFGGTSDEMMEFVNNGTVDIDIAGWRLFVNGSNRHFFPAGTVIGPGSALVVFGGGSPTGEFGGATVQVASEAKSGLGILNSGTTISIFDEADAEIFSYTYTSTEVGVSYTRNPDITGDFVLHPTLNGRWISPGTQVDGTPFVVDNSTKVKFATSLSGAEEADSTFEIEVAIENPSSDAATTANVVLATENLSGDLEYSTQMVTFPAGSSDNQKVTVTVKNDEELEGDELFTFALQDITGGTKAKSGSPFQFNFIILDDDVPLVFNEIHADPASSDAGDANNDGTRDASDDEFIEVVNRSSADIDMSGYYFQDEAQKRHVFPSGTSLQPGHAIVVFGGGEPRGILGAQVQVASEGSGVGLTNTGDVLKIFNASDEIQAGTIYGSDADGDQSITRSPDITGGFSLHTQADGADSRLYSPGRKVNGGVFINIVTDVSGDIEIQELNVYPNPVSHQLNISMNAVQDQMSFQIISLNGEVVRSYTLSNHQLNQLSLTDIRDGLYLYDIRNQANERLSQGKLLIQK
ncbi:MAG: lamin tail domain-containing protein [Reichenbachiella sp.]|uniref:lamin tail domain-containing protein n=1 Tax=Reichenbachiella sp. TaxID=2184521 RepID=UPI00329931C3